MAKRKIRTNTDELIDTIINLEQRLSDLESMYLLNKNAYNSNIVTMAALIKILVKKNFIQEDEITDVARDMIEELKKNLKLNDEEKIQKKEEMYDKILNSDISGNA